MHFFWHPGVRKQNRFQKECVVIHYSACAMDGVDVACGGPDIVGYQRMGRVTPARPCTFGGGGSSTMRVELIGGSWDVVPAMPVVAQLTGGHPLALPAAGMVVRMVVDMLASGAVHCALGMDTIGVEFDPIVSRVTALRILNPGEGGRVGTAGLPMGPVCPPTVCSETLSAQVRSGNPASQMFATLYAGLSIATALASPLPELYSTVPDALRLSAVPAVYDIDGLVSEMLPEMEMLCVQSGYPVGCY